MLAVDPEDPGLLPDIALELAMGPLADLLVGLVTEIHTIGGVPDIADSEDRDPLIDTEVDDLLRSPMKGIPLLVGQLPRGPVPAHRG